MGKNEYKELFALWRKNGALSFVLDEKVKQAFAEAPTGVRVFINPNQFQKTESQPEMRATYTVPGSGSTESPF